MALTPNPLLNMTSGHGDISSMKTFQNFNGTIVATATQSYANPGNYLPYFGNVAAVNNLLTNHGQGGAVCTGIVFSNGEHEGWITRDPVPNTGLPAGTTRFVKAWFDSNENISSGNLSQP